MGFSMDGLDDLKEKFKRMGEKISDAAEKAVKDTADDIFDETQLRVPKGPTGALQASGHVKDGENTNTRKTRIIHYGDSDVNGVGVDYAAAVHEILHAEHAPPTGPKYVEGPLVEGIPDFKKNLVEKMEEAVKEGLA